MFCNSLRELWFGTGVGVIIFNVSRKKDDSKRWDNLWKVVSSLGLWVPKARGVSESIACWVGAGQNDFQDPLQLTSSW